MKKDAHAASEFIAREPLKYTEYALSGWTVLRGTLTVKPVHAAVVLQYAFACVMVYSPRWTSLPAASAPTVEVNPSAMRFLCTAVLPHPNSTSSDGFSCRVTVVVLPTEHITRCMEPAVSLGPA